MLLCKSCFGLGGACSYCRRSGGAEGVELGLGGDISQQKEQSLTTMDQESTTAIHGFYNVSTNTTLNSFAFNLLLFSSRE